jgi:hypothetical protein
MDNLFNIGSLCLEWMRMRRQGPDLAARWAKKPNAEATFLSTSNYACTLSLLLVYTRCW